jgi:signal transduction histidine kinase
MIVHRAIAWSAYGYRAEWLLAGFCALCLTGMIVLDATLAPIPFHFVYAAVTIVYGLRLWRIRGAMIAALVTGISTGGITVYNVIAADEPAPELIEVPLMTMMVVATIWHVRSRQRAAAVVAALADERQRMIERERTFFANVTHDLMTPITIARGHVDILGRSGTPSPEELAETKQVIVEELKRIESMVGDLLLVGRLDDDKAALHRERLDAEEFLHIVADRWAVVGERIWTIDIDAPGTVLVDGNTLSQALDNVIENAVSYTTKGDAITFRGRAIGTTLQIDVIDTGLGIPQSAIPHVFDRFYRADRARSRSTGGSGLGLAIVRDVVEAHGGQVSIESPPDGGTRLKIELPEFRRRLRGTTAARANRSTSAT